MIKANEKTVEKADDRYFAVIFTRPLLIDRKNMEVIECIHQLIIRKEKTMDKNELKSKLFKGITIALPILLVAILAVMIVIAMDIARDDNSVPVLGDNVGTTTTTTTSSTTPQVGEGEPDEPKDPDDTTGEPDGPIEDPSSKGLAFVSNGDGTCSLDGMGECTDSFIIVPMESPNGDIVVEIGDNAFKNCTSIKGIELSETVTRIGSYAFYGSTIRDIEIPSTVREIGNYAFSGCKYLTGITVDKENTNYSSSSGVLYNKEGSVLITYPAGKTDNFVNISRDVTEIANMAFYKCTYVKKVTYHGTSASWKMVEIGAGNDVIDDAIIYCAGDDGK